MIRFTLRDKSPDEDQVYSIDWTPFIGQDTLVAPVTHDVLEGTVIVHNADNPDTHTTRFWIRGGELGEVARILLHQPTTATQVLDAEVIIGVR